MLYTTFVGVVGQFHIGERFYNLVSLFVPYYSGGDAPWPSKQLRDFPRLVDKKNVVYYQKLCNSFDGFLIFFSCQSFTNLGDEWSY